MKEQLQKEIDIIKSNLNTLPQNNKTNIKRYNNYLTDVYTKYNYLFTKISEEVKNRYYSFFPNSNYTKIKNIKTELDSFNTHILFNDYKSTYEKMGIDRLLYDINYFYNNDLEKVNNDILTCISKYREMGLSKLDFNYSSYCSEYVNMLINNKDNEKLIRETFDKIYWKCPEIVTHIELNLKSIYYKNEKKFKKLIEKQDSKYFSKKTKKKLIEDYYNKVREYDSCIENDRLTIYEKFRSGELKIKDYTEDSIKKAYNAIKDQDTIVNEYLNINIKKLTYSLEEYKNFVRYEHIINDIRDRYENKDKFKGIYSNLLKEIKKEESKLFKLNKKRNKISNSIFMSDAKKEEQLSKIYLQITSMILLLKEKYEKLEESSIDDWILTKLVDKSTYRDALLLASCNYNYMINLLKRENENLTLEEAQKVIASLKEFVYSPYNTIINNISITEKKNISLIISDCYNLLNLNIGADNLSDYDKIDSLLANIEIINLSNIIKKQQINLDEIDYIVQVDALNKKKNNIL